MVSDEDVELRTTDLDTLWCMILQKPPVDRPWHLPEGTLLPELSGETERTASTPAMAGKFEFACGGDEHKKAIEPHNGPFRVVSLERRNCGGQEVGMIIVIIVKLLEERPGGCPYAEIQFAPQRRLHVQPDIPDPQVIWHNVSRWFRAVVNNDQFLVWIRLPAEVFNRLLQERFAVPGSENARDQRLCHSALLPSLPEFPHQG